MPILVGCVDDQLDTIQPYAIHRGLKAFEVAALCFTFDPGGAAPKPFAVIDPVLDDTLTGLPAHAYLVFEALPKEWSRWAQAHDVAVEMVGGMTPAWLQSKLGILPAQWLLLQEYLYGDVTPAYVAKRPFYWLWQQVQHHGGATALSATSLGLPEGVSADAFLKSFGTAQAMRTLTKIPDDNLFRLYDFYGKFVARHPNVEVVARFARLHELYFVEALENHHLGARTAWLLFLYEMMVTSCALPPKPKRSTSRAKRSPP